MEKSYSEKLARVFEIVGYVLLIPIIFKGILWIIPLFIYGGILSFAALFSRKHFIYGAIFFAVYFVMLGIFIFGIRLLVGYFRHSRKRLEKKKVDKLWVKTIIFNAIFFFPAFYLHINCWLTQSCSTDWLAQSGNELRNLGESSTEFLLLTVWWGIATFLPFTALFSIKNNDER